MVIDITMTSCLYFLVEVFVKVMKVSVASLEQAVLFLEFISAVNSTNYSSYRIARSHNHPIRPFSHQVSKAAW